MKRAAFPVIAILLAAMLGGQAVCQTPAAVLVQSFRTGKTRVPEQNMVVNLNVDAPNFDSRIRDSSGEGRYVLSIVPHRVDVADTRIAAWEVKLIDSHRRYLGNLLVGTVPTEPLSDRAEDRAWRLDPNPYAPVQLLAKRVFKVENFYCTVEVKDWHRLTLDRLLLESMKVEVAFSNASPMNN